MILPILTIISTLVFASYITPAAAPTDLQHHGAKIMQYLDSFMKSLVERYEYEKRAPLSCEQIDDVVAYHLAKFFCRRVWQSQIKETDNMKSMLRTFITTQCTDIKIKPLTDPIQCRLGLIALNKERTISKTEQKPDGTLIKTVTVQPLIQNKILKEAVEEKEFNERFTKIEYVMNERTTKHEHPELYSHSQITALLSNRIEAVGSVEAPKRRCSFF